MTEPSSTPDLEESILLQFQQEYEAADDKEAVLRDFRHRYRLLAERIQARAAMVERLARGTPTPAAPLPERFGEFQVLRQVGFGGMGQVYEARHDRLNRRVAVKTIRPDRVSPVAANRFRREERALARLHQTHIVSIFEAGEEGPVHYFAMPYIDGAPLSSVLKKALCLETSTPRSPTPSLSKLAKQLKPGQKPPPPPTEAESTRLTLSLEYFRSVAEAVADVAEALQHAHNAGLLHRDLKPSNLMVDRLGHCWVIDFGLTCLLAEQDSAGGLSLDAVLSAETVTTTGVVGTPPYMAPEQWPPEKEDNRADVTPLDARTDVYGLGVTLYELLTLRSAFKGSTQEEIRTKILKAKPDYPLEERTPNVPPDLAAICRKAMQKARKDRYTTAQEFADDLRRWLRSEPTKARGAWAGRRVWLWGKRNPGWAASLFTALVAVLVLAVALLATAQARAAAAQAKADESERAKRDAIEREQAVNFELRLRDLQRLRLTDRTDHWFNRSWEEIGKAAQIKKTQALKNEAAATLIGLDAIPAKEFTSFDSSWLIFDPKGDRLLFGAAPARPPIRKTTSGAKVWDLQKENLSEQSKQTEGGPVAFRRDGTPVQLVPGEKLSLQLWDVSGRASLQEFRFSADVEKEGMQLAGSPAGFAILAATPDASLIAAVAGGPKGKGAVAVWDGATGKRLLEVSQQATAVALSPSGTLLAAADPESDITVWSLPDGKVRRQFRVIRGRVDALSFSADAAPMTAVAGVARMKGKLAVGGDGGGLGIWDLAEKQTVAICRGSLWGVFCATFSPDGTILASGGRGLILWDTATGRKLLSLTGQDWVTGLAFSPDGQRLATGGRSVFGGNRSVIWRLEDGHGIQTMRGLSQPIKSVVLSRDGKRLAALTHDWEIGVWDLPQGRLRRIFRVPPGIVDNAAVAFSRDGRQLAYCSGQAARLWDLDSDEAPKEWTLPRGLVDRMAFDADGRLLLFRFEMKDRVCYIRNLLGAKPLDPIAIIPDFNAGLIDALLAPDGRHVAVVGRSGPKGEERWVKVFTTADGKKVWEEKMEFSDSAVLTIDPEGKILGFQTWRVGSSDILAELSTGKHIDSLSHMAFGLSPGAKYTATVEPNPVNESGVLALHYGKGRPRLLDLGIDVPVSFGRVEFDGDGNCVVWGNNDGTVSVADLKEVQRRLAALGLGWE